MVGFVLGGGDLVMIKRDNIFVFMECKFKCRLVCVLGIRYFRFWFLRLMDVVVVFLFLVNFSVILSFLVFFKFGFIFCEYVGIFAGLVKLFVIGFCCSMYIFVVIIG